jgi:hypothetical protein
MGATSVGVFVWLSGADPDLLKRLSRGERVYFQGLGGAVLGTAVMACVSMVVAMQIALSAPWGVAAAVAGFWFLFILNLDRWLVSTLRRGGRLVFLVVPRVMLAILFGAIISTPLVLQIFDREINKELAITHAKNYQDHVAMLKNSDEGKRIAQLQVQQSDLENKARGGIPPDLLSNPDIKALQSQLNTLQAQKSAADDAATCELTGDKCQGTSGKSGPGARYQNYKRHAAELQTQIDSVNAQLDQKIKDLRTGAAGAADKDRATAATDLPGVRAQLKTLQDRQAKELADFQASNVRDTGLLSRLDALDKAAGHSFMLQAAQWMLWLFITVIDCLPVAVKTLLLTGRATSYERIQEKHEEAQDILARAELQVELSQKLREMAEERIRQERLTERRRELAEEVDERRLELERRATLREVIRQENEQRGAALGPAPGTGPSTNGAHEPIAGWIQPDWADDGLDVPERRTTRLSTVRRFWRRISRRLSGLDSPQPR